jgi:NAD(P)H-nitrite reductase large subunit
MKAFDYLIIGNSAGGIGAAEAIREVDTDGTMAIVSDEAYQAYSRPLISKLLSGERTIESMLFRAPDFYQKNRIDFLPGVRAEKLNPAQHMISLDNGTELTYSKLLLATGGEPISPQVTGNGKNGVFFFQSIDNALKIGEYVKKDMRAVVIGGGLIGLSLSEALTKKGVNVTIIELKDRVLNTILDETGSAIVREVLESKGINVVTNHTITEVKGITSVNSVLLDNGEELPCDMLAFAIGVSPRIELAKKAKINVNRGIIVDSTMATGTEDIYACGDAVETYDFIKQENRVIPIWPNAYIGGRTAGFNLAGVRTEYPFSTVMNSLNYFGMSIVTAGDIETAGQRNVKILEFREDQTYKKLLIKNGYITGMVFINDIDKAGMLFGLMRENINVKDFSDSLLDEEFGLAYLPDKLRWQRLGISKNGNSNINITDKQPTTSKV